MQSSQSTTTFEDLTKDALSVIYGFIIPERIKFIARINRASAVTVSDNLFWKEKFKKHFPHRFTEFPENTTQWYKALFTVYFNEYSRMPECGDDLASFFSMVKEKDIETFRRRINEWPFILMSYLEDMCDRNNMSPMDWAYKVNFQSFLNEIYQRVYRECLKQQSYYWRISSYVLGQGRLPVEVKLSDDKTLLYFAIATNKPPPVIAHLLSQGSSLDERYWRHGKSYHPVHAAAQFGRLDLLMQWPQQWNIPDSEGFTALDWAVFSNQEATAIYLYRNGATLFLSRMLHAIVRNGMLELLKLLVDNNVKLDLRDDFGRTTLMAAAIVGQNEIVMYIASKFPRLIDQVTNDGDTALLLTIAERKEKTALCLLEAGASVTIGNHQRIHPIHMASKLGLVAVVRRILQINSGMANVIDLKYRRPLHFAAARGHLAIAGLLIDYGASLTEDTLHFGETPLMRALVNQRLAMVLLLLRRNPDQTPLLAIDNSHASCTLDALNEYIKTRETAKHNKTQAFSLFGMKFLECRQNAAAELDAAMTIKEVIYYGADLSCLTEQRMLIIIDDSTLRYIHDFWLIKNLSLFQAPLTQITAISLKH